MSILYCAVACGHRVLCEQNKGNVDFSGQIKNYLNNQLQEYITFAIGRDTFNSYNRNGISYIAIADASTSQQQTLGFLRKLEQSFIADPSRVLEAQSGSEHCHQIDFGRVLSEEMANFSNQDQSKLMGLQSQLNDVHLLMHENIVNLNERGTKLDDMVDKTDKFADDAEMFGASTRRIKNQKYMENLKMKLIIFGVICAIVFVILMIILWQSGVFN